MNSAEVAFIAQVDGTEQKYVLMLPEGFAAADAHDMLIALHGHGADRWQFVKNPRDECRAARDVATAHTMIYVSPDYRAPTSWMGPKANLIEYAQFQEAIQESYGGTKTQVPGEYRKRSAELWPERLTMPVGITASGQDTSVPPDSVLRLGKALATINRNVLVIHREELGHITAYDDATAILEVVIARAGLFR